MTPKISVIIPVYNVEKYLPKCLDSILNQTLKEIEVICVDDASTDSSVEIIREYMKKDERIFLIQNKENKGPGASRNTGLMVAKSEFVAFVDSDDDVDLDTYKKAIHHMTPDIDLVIFGIQAYNQKDKTRKKFDAEYYAIRYNGKISLSPDVLYRTDVSPCNKIFRKCIIDKHKVQFAEGLRYEDNYFFYSYCCWIRNIFFMPDQLYHYLRHDNSIMDDTFSKKEGCSIDHTEIGIKLYNYMKQNNIFDQWNNFFFHRFLFFVSFSLYHENSKSYREKIYALAISFLKKEKLFDLVPPELIREYEMLDHHSLLSEKRFKYGGLVLIKEKISKKVFYVLGLPLLQIRYKKGMIKYYLFSFIPVFKKKMCYKNKEIQ